MQTVIHWTRYDGTPGTLPRAGEDVLLCRDGKVGHKCYNAIDGSWDFGTWCVDQKVGDLWAPWPQAPEVEG